MKFEAQYKRLNIEQKKAVDTTEGPVMVIAGPGTGKTQVIALRIGHILEATDTEANAILCLTFTRSGVTAMQNRLEDYIGKDARNVTISTFHSFAINLIDKHYPLLDFAMQPKLLDDTEAVVIVDELLENGEWQYLRPRADPTKYFRDLKNLISILKRERMSAEDFMLEVETEIKIVENDPANISTRGESKGKLKKEAEKKIESLERSREVVEFYKKYEEAKRELNFMDYDDVLKYAVDLVEEYEDVRADIRENYQYILVDEHQDSSGVQNAFLKAVWGDVEQPNIFVVGDDRQLIYGFSGANIDYFTDFKTAFGKATMIVLTENYRSSAPILALAEELLQSTVTNEKLRSNATWDEKINLSEYNYNRDEIIGAGLYFKKVIESGISASECVLLLPKNYHVRSATRILRAMGIPVVSEQNVSLLDLPETESLLNILGIVSDPYDYLLLAESLLDKSSLVPPLVAHTFLKNIKKKEDLKIQDLVDFGKADGLFQSENQIGKFGDRLKNWVDTLTHERVSYIVSVIGNELLIDQAKSHEELLASIEIVRSFIHASTAWEEKNKNGKLGEFLEYFKRLATYQNNVPVARFGTIDGVNVMTLHKSKGLEYEHVIIAHLNQEIFLSEKNAPFALPESVKAKIAERDEMVARRELYVAITRAKRYCTLSYAKYRDDGVELTLADIVADLTSEHFHKNTAEENQDKIIADNPRNYTSKPSVLIDTDISVAMKQFVRERFAETNISVSMLNNFFECPWKWYFRNFLKLPETKSVSLALGSAVHATIEYILKEKKLPTELAIKNKIKISLEQEGIYETKDIARLGKDAHKMIENWIEVYYKNLADDYTSERSVPYRDKAFPNLSMYGKIDLTERIEGNIVVTDFKTGSSKTSGMIEKIDEEGRLSDLMRQLAMYSYLIQGKEGNTVSESRLLFLEEIGKNKNALYSTRIEDEQIKLLVKDISDYQNLLTNGEWTDRPCNAKTYGQNKECEYCKRMERILAE